MSESAASTNGVEETRRLVGELSGSPVVDLQRTSSPDAWFAELADGMLVVAKRAGRRSRPGSLSVEAWVYTVCAEHGVAAPRVVGLSDEPECLVTMRLPGEPLPRNSPMTADVRTVWRDAGADLRRLHEIPLTGFGPLVPGDQLPRGEASAWSPWVEFARQEGIRWLVDAGHLDRRVGDRLVARFDDAAATLRGFADPRLLHGDLQSLHILHTPSRYQGIVDFGQSQAGDPRWDLARLLLWDRPVDLDALIEGYGDDVLTIEDRRVVLPIYLLAFAIRAAVGHSRSDYIQLLLEQSKYTALL